jgi:glycosyltransferase involved in cell wall biosynthesis
MTCPLNILLLLPDNTKNPFGGMGVQAEGIMSNMSDVNFFEHNITTSRFLQLSENVDNYAFISQLISQITELPKIDLLKKIDIVHSFDASTSIQGNAIAKMINKPHIMTLQLSMNSLFNIFYNKTDELVSGIEFSCMNSADAVIHVSKEYLNKYAILNPNSYYLPNGIDLDKWNNTASQVIELPGRKNAKKMCYIGRYAEMKNIEAILNAKIPKEIDIYFIGSSRGGHDYYFNEMLKFVEENENAYYLGEKFGEEKINILKLMDSMIVPSIHEPFGIVCLEALASKCILLSSFQSGMKEYLTEDIALNCGVNSSQIEKSIKKWLNLSIDEIEKRNNLGIELCKKYSWKNSANILKKIYLQIKNYDYRNL